jgi:hypothetical protein
LESVANAHTAADLHVRPDFKNRAGLKAVGAANALRDTSCLVSRNGNDSTPVPAKSTSHSQNRAAALARIGKVLNLCRDSKRRSAVIFLSIAQNKFTNRLRWSGAEMNFRTTDRRYADK